MSLSRRGTTTVRVCVRVPVPARSRGRDHSMWGTHCSCWEWAVARPAWSGWRMSERRPCSSALALPRAAVILSWGVSRAAEAVGEGWSCSLTFSTQ